MPPISDSPKEWKITTHLKNFENSRLWGLHFVLPEDVYKAIASSSKEKRIMCTINNKVTIHSGIMSNGEFHFVLVNKELQKKLNAQIGDIWHIHITLDSSKYGMEVPQELEILLSQDLEGESYFSKLTPGKQRNLIYIVTKYKSEPKRIHTAIILIDHLKNNHGKIDFKKLNEELKK